MSNQGISFSAQNKWVDIFQESQGVSALQTIWSMLYFNIWYQFMTLLTHWDRAKKATILQMTFSNAYSWMKKYELRWRFHWNLFPRVQVTIFPHWFCKWHDIEQATNHYLNYWWSHIYASLDCNKVNESFILNHWGRVAHICVSKLTIIGSKACRLVGAKPLSEPMLGYC